MREALSLARRGLGRTSPNPPVGAAIVRDGRIVGRGWHERVGGPHAEVTALAEAGEAAAGATLYVTLEPCCHRGRTGPCTEAIHAAGLARVCVGMRDPDPQVAGGGEQALRAAGIDVLHEPLQGDIERFYEPYRKHRETGLPFVTLKTAMSLDGKTATRSGDSRWISGETARERTRRMRSEVDAVLVGIGTVLADDPLLTTRAAGAGRDAAAVVVDSRARTPREARLLHRDSAAPVLIAVTDGAPGERVAALRQAGAEVIVCGAAQGRVDLRDLISQLGERGMLHVLCEGGGTLAAGLLQAGLIDKVLFVIAPRLLGGREAPTPLAGDGVARLCEGAALRNLTVERVGDDILVEGYVCSPAS